VISVLLATTGRPQMAADALRNIADTTRGHKIEIVVAADVDPVAASPLPRHCTLVYDYRPELRGSSKAWNDALKLSTGDPVVLTADDVVFHPGWIEAALEALEQFPGGWGFVGLNDGHWGADLSTHYLMSRRLITEVFGGVVAWECYLHSFQDREANARAQAAGRYVWCGQARITHRHWLWGERVQDETDTRNLGGHTASEMAFHARAAAGFPNDYEPVIR
jgi:glycosyltransferase involved in cell wall biosynthesis